jgi:hypothetical protein
MWSNEGNRLLREEFPVLPRLKHLEVNLISPTESIYHALERKFPVLATVGQCRTPFSKFYSPSEEKTAVIHKLNCRLGASRLQCIQEMTAASAQIQQVNGPPRKKRKQC